MGALMLPAERWSCGDRIGVLLVTLAVVLLWQPAFAATNRTMLRTGGVGIVPLELIGSEKRARRVLERWGRGPGWRAARWSLVVDYPFLVAYGLGLWTLAAVVGSHADTRGWEAWADVIRWAGWGFVVAAVLDAIENTALLFLLYDKAVEAMAKVSLVSAALKFLLLIVGLFLVLNTAVAFVGP